MADTDEPQLESSPDAVPGPYPLDAPLLPDLYGDPFDLERSQLTDFPTQPFKVVPPVVLISAKEFALMNSVVNG